MIEYEYSGLVQGFHWSKGCEGYLFAIDMQTSPDNPGIWTAESGKKEDINLSIQLYRAFSLWPNTQFTMSEIDEDGNESTLFDVTNQTDDIRCYNFEDLGIT